MSNKILKKQTLNKHVVIKLICDQNHFKSVKIQKGDLAIF